MKKEAIELLQFRIQQEQLSSRIYEQMSLWLDNQGYTGSASLWVKYSQEELKHAEFAKEYLLSFGITPELRKLDAPVASFKDLCEVIHATFDHEVLITQQCNELATKASAMGDHLLYTLGLKYCAEQIEESEKTQNLIDQLKTFGEDKIALRLLDNYLGSL
jgi:ferritin